MNLLERFLGRRYKKSVLYADFLSRKCANHRANRTSPLRMSIVNQLAHLRYLEWNEYEKLMDTIEQREEYPRHLSK